MVITYHGDHYFKISSGETTILVDPANQRSYKGASLILFTEKSIGEERDGGDVFLIDHPGEFEVGGIRIRGWLAEGNDKTLRTAYRVVFDDITLAIIGTVEKEPGNESKEFLEDIDIAIAPAGGKGMLSAAAISKFLRQIEPGIIIPADDGSGKNLKDFFKEFGAEGTKCDGKLVLKKKDISPNQMKIVCLKSE